MYEVVLTFFNLAHPGNPDHLVIFDAVTFCEITVSKDRLFGQSFTYVLRIYKVKEAFAVTIIYCVFRIPDKTLVERELDSLFCLVIIFRIRSVANTFIAVEINIVDTAVIR